MSSEPQNALQFGFLGEHIGFQLHLCGRAVWRLLRPSSKARASRRPSGFNSAVVIIGCNPGISPKRLAEALYLDPQATNSILDRLEDEGFADRVRSPSDRRRVMLSLTKRGEEEMSVVETRSKRQEDQLAKSLTDEERETLIALLTKVRNNIMISS
ncbi:MULTISPECIES: MarR family winged helix-turn-helix transcriptional regulator [unclassified Sphingobium]|uniref:MarR family winged helix-turn-helix transcriptional regulator n=1 Tax=unclassified Sphingobium TaxID=2611147 RepID=UPI002224A274|nr:MULTISPECIES: MarR family transcriptional regulator [unclassified Sphingobium]MCW2393752.1 DNA-binding MarR family transcriptional regulator [Sphingobium sp. B8D3B]MCW2417265.1 DNA-binding MarR family transcriptional regulator [Sphingobium sp. B8D3C]